jgi:hypothetical protein
MLSIFIIVYMCTLFVICAHYLCTLFVRCALYLLFVHIICYLCILFVICAHYLLFVHIICYLCTWFFICAHYLLFVLFRYYLCCSVYCLCVNVYYHRVTTQLQLINISHHIIINLCMFQATMGPSPWEATVFMRHLVRVILCGWLSGMQAVIQTE